MKSFLTAQMNLKFQQFRICRPKPVFFSEQNDYGMSLLAIKKYKWIFKKVWNKSQSPEIVLMRKIVRTIWAYCFTDL